MIVAFFERMIHSGVFKIAVAGHEDWEEKSYILSRLGELAPYASSRCSLIVDTKL